jgi:hypothetical protein
VATSATRSCRTRSCNVNGVPSAGTDRTLLGAPSGVSTVVWMRLSRAFVVRRGSLSTRTDSIDEGVVAGEASCLAVLARWRWSTLRVHGFGWNALEFARDHLTTADLSLVWLGRNLRGPIAASEQRGTRRGASAQRHRVPPSEETVAALTTGRWFEQVWLGRGFSGIARGIVL